MAGRLRWLVVPLVLALACAFVIERGQDANWDLQNYHYFSGYAYLKGRFAEDVMPGNLGTYLDPVPSVLSYLAYAKIPFPWSSLLLLVVQLASVPALLLIAREIGKSLGHPRATVSETAAVAVGLVSPMWWGELGTSFYSSTTTPLVLFGVWLMLRGVALVSGSGNATPLFAISGALLGLSVTLKLTNALFLAAGAAALAPLLLMRPRVAIGAAAAYTMGAVIGAALNAQWYAAVYREFGNPIFPFYNAIFRSEYFDPVNFHDGRWMFTGIEDFIRYIGSAAAGTTKTSEIAFADARLAIGAALGALALGLRLSGRDGPRRRRYGPAAAVLLLFFSASFAAWVFMFAYQRYLIPLELLLGPVAWILLDYLLVTDRRVAVGLAVCFVVAIALVRIPDWGHLAAERVKGSNVFGLKIPGALIRSPAEYLIVGVPISYVLPFVHEDSHFYRIDFSPRVFERIREQLARHRDRPVRLLARNPWMVPVTDVTRDFGYEAVGACTNFESLVGTYITCEMRPLAK